MVRLRQHGNDDLVRELLLCATGSGSDAAPQSAAEIPRGCSPELSSASEQAALCGCDAAGGFEQRLGHWYR